MIKAAEVLHAGGTKDEIVETARYHVEHMEHMFTVEDLEYLAKGGRVSKASSTSVSFTSGISRSAVFT